MKLFLQALVLGLASSTAAGAAGGLRAKAQHPVVAPAGSKLAHEGPPAEGATVSSGKPAAPEGSHNDEDVEDVSAYQMPIQAVVALEGMARSSVRRVANSVRQDPQGETKEAESGGGGSGIFMQLLFGVLYYFLIVTKYPDLKEKSDMANQEQWAKAQELQDENEVTATFCQTSAPNCLFSWCCSASRAAHTFHTTGILNYWPSLCLMACFPCCTLWIVNSFTELNTKLGGKQRNCFMGLICACLCSCCVIAQDAETLDVLTGHRTTCCGVEEDTDGQAGFKRNAEAGEVKA